MNHVVNQKQGFTLIELMLAMTFISVLLLAIAMTVIQIGNIYNRGMTVKDINQVGRFIADDLGRTAAQSESLVMDRDYRENSAGGRVCFGKFSYIWNTKMAIEANDTNLTKFDDGTNARLVKVPDSTGIYCELNATGGLLYAEIRGEDSGKAQELLPEGDQRLGINQFVMQAADQVTDTKTGQSVASLQFVISSGKLESMTIDRLSCLGPNDTNSDLTYCHVQPFDIVIRTGNKAKVEGV